MLTEHCTIHDIVQRPASIKGFNLLGEAEGKLPLKNIFPLAIQSKGRKALRAQILLSSALVHSSYID